MSDSQLEHEKVVPTALKAALQVADTERSFSMAMATAEIDHDNPEQRLAYSTVKAFYDLVEIQGVAEEELDIVLELFCQNLDLRNATLKRIEMAGEWKATDEFERQLLRAVDEQGYGSLKRFSRIDVEAKGMITIPAGFTDQSGFVALRRRRLLMTGDQDQQGFRPHLEIDKTSSFALNLEKLDALSSDTAREVRLIIAASMYCACNWDIITERYGGRPTEDDIFDLGRIFPDKAAKYEQEKERALQTALRDAKHLAAAMKRNDISLASLMERLSDKAPVRLKNTAAIEWAIGRQHGVLIPAATTYYAHS